MNRLLVRGARVVDPSRNLDETMDLLTEDGLIQKLAPIIDEGADRVIDAAGLTLLPGLCDMHVHLRDPGLTEKEDILTGCRAAAAGGVTSLLAMPNTSPTVDTPETVSYILEKAQRADARVYVTGCISKHLQSEELTDFAALKRAGVIALSDDGKPVLSAAMMAEALRRAAKLSLKVVAHCEDLSLSNGGLMHEGAVSEELGLPGVPAASENAATAREIALAQSYGVPVHICHVSTGVAAAMIRDAKKRGVRVTAETAPHYLALTHEALRNKNADWRMSPPLRTEEDRLALIEALNDGTIDAIATDHAPHTEQDKVAFMLAPNGSIGMETSLAVCFTELVKTGIMTLPALVEKMSLNPAGILGLNAGTLLPGAPADFLLFDENRRWTVSRDFLHGKSKNTPFHGRKLTGKVLLTVCGGRIVFDAAAG